MTELTRVSANVPPGFAPGRTDNVAPQHLISPEAGGILRIVLVDDDDDFREAIGAELEDLGFHVTGLPDGPSMLEYFAAGNSSDVVVLDWRLPGTSGLDLLGQARRRGIAVPVVFLTGMPAAAYENAALDGGAMDFVNKSRGATILAKRIRLICEAGKLPPAERHEETIVCGELVLRPKVSRAVWRDRDLNLTVVEFNIIRLLVQNVGEYVTYRAIYDCVHHAGFIAGDGENGYRTNVRSSIKRIRNKFRALDPDFGEIENFLAFGYRWRSETLVA